MLTLFSAPKPFLGPIRTIQRNALRSWTLLRCVREIILFGDEEGVGETAREFGVRHVPDVLRNRYGTPLVSDLMEKARKGAACDLLCLVNSDVILMGDFAEAVERTARRKRRFLLVGRRWGLDLKEDLRFGPGWEARLRARVQERGKMGTGYQMDYFVFPRGIWGPIPPFALGRPGWDNWLVFRARKDGVPVVDISGVACGIHQDHDYTHVPERRGAVWEGPEADLNRELMGGMARAFSVFDATHRMGRRGLYPALGRRYLLRRCLGLPALFPRLKPVVERLKDLGFPPGLIPDPVEGKRAGTRGKRTGSGNGNG